jgi:NitT/TauT family transport system substrate-binding protein
MRYRTLIAFYIISLLFTACERCSSDSSPDCIRIGFLYMPDALPFVCAQKEGIFEEEGVQVKLIPFQSIVERDSALQAGELDAVLGDLVSTYMLRSSGQKVRVALMSFYSPFGRRQIGIVSSPQSSVHTVQDLKGVGIGMAMNSVVEYISDQLLFEEGFTEQDLVKTNISNFSIRLNMLVENQIPAAIFPEPLASYAESRGCHHITDDENDDVVIGALAVSESMMERSPDALLSCVKAVNRAVENIMVAPEAFTDLLGSLMRVPKGCEFYYDVPPYPKNRVPTEEQVARVSEWLKTKGLIDSTHDYKEFITDAFLEKTVHRDS